MSIRFGAAATQEQNLGASVMQRVNGVLKRKRQAAMRWVAAVDRGEFVGNKKYQPMIREVAEVVGCDEAEAGRLLVAVVRTMIVGGLV